MVLLRYGATFSGASSPPGRYGQRSQKSGQRQWGTLLSHDCCAQGRAVSPCVRRGLSMALPGAIGPPRVEFTPVLLTVRADEGVRDQWLPHMEATHAAELLLLDSLFIAQMQLLKPDLDSRGATPHPELGFPRFLVSGHRRFNPAKPRACLTLRNSS